MREQADALAEDREKPILATWHLRVCAKHPHMHLAPREEGRGYCLECNEEGVEVAWVEVMPVRDMEARQLLAELAALLPDCPDCRRRIIRGEQP